MIWSRIRISDKNKSIDIEDHFMLVHLGFVCLIELVSLLKYHLVHLVLYGLEIVTWSTATKPGKWLLLTVSVIWIFIGTTNIWITAIICVWLVANVKIAAATKRRAITSVATNSKFWLLKFEFMLICQGKDKRTLCKILLAASQILLPFKWGVPAYNLVIVSLD